MWNIWYVPNWSACAENGLKNGLMKSCARWVSIHFVLFGRSYWRMTSPRNLKNVTPAHADRLSANRRVREIYLSLSMSKHRHPQKITVQWLREKQKTVTRTHDIILLTLHQQLGLCSWPAALGHHRSEELRIACYKALLFLVLHTTRVQVKIVTHTPFASSPLRLYLHAFFGGEGTEAGRTHILPSFSLPAFSLPFPWKWCTNLKRDWLRTGFCDMTKNMQMLRE